MHWARGCVSQDALGREVSAQRGVCPGVSTQRGVCPGGALPVDVYPEGFICLGVSALWCLPMGMWQTHPRDKRQKASL